MKSMSMVTIKTSFAIWSLRDNPVWDKSLFSSSFDVTPSQPVKPTLPRKTPPSTKTTKQLTKTVPESDQPKLNGIVNKGNTCYASSIIQCLFALPSFRSNFFTISSLKAPLSKSFHKICNLLNTGTAAIDPSFF